MFKKALSKSKLWWVAILVVIIVLVVLIARTKGYLP